MSTNTNLLDSFIKDLEELNTHNVVSVVIPSTGVKKDFKLFSVSQHKELLKAAFEGYDGVIRSSIIFNDIVSGNCTEDDVEFTLADRSYILTQMRRVSLGEDIVINDKTYNLSDLSEPKFDLELEDIEYKGISVKLSIPNLQRDSAISKKIITEFQRIDDETKETEAINIVLTFEIIKFIDSLKIGDNTYTFDDVNLYESKKIVDSLPLKLNNMIIEAISNFRIQEEKSITFNDGTILEIDASFLSAD